MTLSTQWPEMSDRKRLELRYLLRQLKQFMPYQRAVLFGRYAGAEVKNNIGGFELLLITFHKPEKEGWQLEKMLQPYYPYEFCEEKIIHIETASMDEINRLGTENWFYTLVRDTGVIVKNDSRMDDFFDGKPVELARRYAHYRGQYDYFFGAASAMLDDAERRWLDSKPLAAFVALSYAAELFLRSVEAVFYDNHIRADDLATIFRRVRHFARELNQAFSLEDREKLLQLRELSKMRREPCMSSEELRIGVYRSYLGRVRLIQRLVQKVCERHLFYLEHGKSKSQMEDEAFQKAYAEVSRPDGSDAEFTLEDGAE